MAARSAPSQPDSSDKFFFVCAGPGLQMKFMVSNLVHQESTNTLKKRAENSITHNNGKCIFW